MQVEFKGRVLRRMESLAIQEKALSKQLEEAIKSGNSDAILKVKYDLKQTEKGNGGVHGLYL